MNVQGFGTIGNSIVDDTAMLQAAIKLGIRFAVIACCKMSVYCRCWPPPLSVKHDPIWRAGGDHRGMLYDDV